MRRILELMGSATPGNATKSSVLLLLYPWMDEIYTVFMLRPDYGGVHGGQISFPGGKYEPGDSDLQSTALRETWEELGIEPQKVTIIGALSDLYIPPSRYLVKPFVGFIPERPNFQADPQEVEEVIELPVSQLIRETSVQTVRHKIGPGVRMKAPAYLVNGYIIWGATAMIFSEFKEIITKLSDID